MWELAAASRPAAPSRGLDVGPAVEPGRARSGVSSVISDPYYYYYSTYTTPPGCPVSHDTQPLVAGPEYCTQLGKSPAVAQVKLDRVAGPVQENRYMCHDLLHFTR